MIRAKIDRRKFPPSPLRDQVAEYLSQGLEVWQVAERLGLTNKSVHRHLDQIRKKLGAQAV